MRFAAVLLSERERTEVELVPCLKSHPLRLRPSRLLSLQVYALTTALCVASAKSTRRSSSRENSERNVNGAADAMATDDTIDGRDDGPSFGRLVVDGCCHAFAGALHKVGTLCRML